METGDLLGPEDATRCWQALRYTTPKAASTTPTLRGPQGQVATTITEKEALVREVAFPPAPGGSPQEDLPRGKMHTQVKEETTKLPSPTAPMELGQPPDSGTGQAMFSPRGTSPGMESGKGDPAPEA
ncbi:hypothetical protein VTN96DRAFT_7923 [Rasamsonia emersonii]